MKALASLKNVDTESSKNLILRNLSRILDIRIIDIDTENSMISFVYSAQESFNQVKRELERIGFPIQNCKTKFAADLDAQKSTNQKSSTFMWTSRPPYFEMHL